MKTEEVRMVRNRKRYTAQEKMSILRRHLVDKVPVSDLCDELGLQPTVFYRWQKQLFENGISVFEKHSNGKKGGAEERRIEALEAKLRRKDEVLSELMEEHVALKKSLGEL
jgi:transposase-like protein